MVDATQSLARDRVERLPILGTLGGAFALFGAAPLFFLALSIVSEVPGLIRLAIVGTAGAQKLAWSTLYALVGNLLVAVFVYSTVSFLAIKAAEGARPTIGAASRVGVRRYLPMLGTTLITMLAVYAGMILLLVPGVMAACAFAVSIPVCAVEPLGPVECLRRSAALTKGSRWRIFAVYLAFFIPLIALGVANLFLVKRAGHPLAAEVVTLVVSFVTVPLSILLGVALYVELRRLRENVGVASVFD